MNNGLEQVVKELEELGKRIKKLDEEGKDTAELRNRFQRQYLRIKVAIAFAEAFSSFEGLKIHIPSLDD